MAFPVMAAIGAASALGGLFSRQSRAPRIKYSDVDPNNYAERRYQELTDPNSQYNRGQYNNLLRLALSSSPSLDALLGASAASGGSTAFAQQQARANTARAGEAAFTAYEGQRGQTEGLAQGYLGQYYGNRQFVTGTNQQAALAEYQDRNAFSNQLIGLGGGLLGMSLLGNPNQTAEAATRFSPGGVSVPSDQDIAGLSSIGSLGFREGSSGSFGPAPSMGPSSAIPPSNIREGLNYGAPVTPFALPNVGQTYQGASAGPITYGGRPRRQRSFRQRNPGFLPPIGGL